MVKVIRMVIKGLFGGKIDREGVCSYSFNLSELFCDLKRKVAKCVCVCMCVDISVSLSI